MRTQTRLTTSDWLLALFVILAIAARVELSAAPAYLDSQFELPSGFRIYRAAAATLSGGSYALTFDGAGRLLVGDGEAVRRLEDSDADGVFDRYEVIATGLGGRGPQGLLVVGDRLYAVGGDGLQLFEGYNSGGKLLHRGRLGNAFSTGGDHDAHTILRGHDGWIYMVVGDGAGARDRKHITEDSSPRLFERAASVFRISPDGQRWECLASGGRNPPSLGMNYLGELFSFDSDMEFHVSVPFYRPVRLNHWALGGDQGWQDVGAFPPYYLDCLPGLLDVGRGSPNWGVFYEHTQLPPQYRDAFLVCDYLWKSAADGNYSTSGRLVAFHLRREGAGWKATMDTLARARSGARDADGKPINFALVDATVAPDGSLYVSDHNQGVWRIFYDPTKQGVTAPKPPWVDHGAPGDASMALRELLTLPQPGAEWSRIREQRLRAALGDQADNRLRESALDPALPARQRLQALRLIAPRFSDLPESFLARLALDSDPELRGQAAWLYGLQGGEPSVRALSKLAEDPEPFVRRRSMEAFTRVSSTSATPAILERLSDSSRLVRYVAMNALAHRPTSEWLAKSLSSTNAQTRMRGLVATTVRHETNEPGLLRNTVLALIADPSLSREDELDCLRVLGLFQGALATDPALKGPIEGFLSRPLPPGDKERRWERIRLIGEYHVGKNFGALLAALEAETDPVTQFHIAQALSRLKEGWTHAEEKRLIHWLLGTQRGWFSELGSKGLQFSGFWATVLNECVLHHRPALQKELKSLDVTSRLGGIMLDQLARPSEGEAPLLALYGFAATSEAKARIVSRMNRTDFPGAVGFLRAEVLNASDPKLRGAFIQALAGKNADPADKALFIDGLRHVNPDIARLSARALLQMNLALDESIATSLLTALVERPEVYHSIERTLVGLTDAKPAGYQKDGDPNRRADEPTRDAGARFWSEWFEQRYKRTLALKRPSSPAEKSDEEIHRFLMGDGVKGGSSSRGAGLYQQLQCVSCHGGSVTPGPESRIYTWVSPVFGPDLAGVTRRLSRAEFADAVVYPSKQVADRFKAFEVELNDGTTLSGFITERNDQGLTLSDRDRVHQLPMSRIKSVAPQAASLMPEHLLNKLSWSEIQDLFAFLNR